MPCRTTTSCPPSCEAPVTLGAPKGVIPGGMQTHLVRPGSSGGRHFQGGTGPPVQCESCQRPLVLLWDLDGTDPVVRSLFGEHERVPVLYCWRCAGEVGYKLVDGGVKRLFTSGRDQGDDFPY